MKLNSFLLCFITLLSTVCGSENFVLFNEKTDQIILTKGSSDLQISPWSTFKIPLCLLSFDQGILIDQDNPVWPYENQEAFLEVWKGPQTPKSWITNSVIWYSRAITPLIGLENITHALVLFDYGNKDMSGDPGQNNGLTDAWLGSSLKISAKNQVDFLKKLVRNELPVSSYAQEVTKSILFMENFDGWDLYGKTGSGYRPDENGSISLVDKIAWFIGWIEKGSQRYIFAYNIQGRNDVPSKADRIARVKALFAELEKPEF